MRSRREGGEVPCTVGFATKRSGPGPPVSSADWAREPRSRREEEVDARASSTTSNTEIGRDPIGPKGCGGVAPSSSLPLLGDGRTSPSSRLLEFGPTAPATDGTGGPGQDLVGRGGVPDCTSSTPRRANPVFSPGIYCGRRMAAICRAFRKSCSSPRRRQRRVAKGSPPGEPIGHALAVVRHKRRRRAVT
jgi:hypothetical protein